MTDKEELQAWIRANRKPHGNAKTLTHEGHTLTYKQWSVVKGITLQTIYDRIRHKWTVAETLDTPQKTNQYR